MSEGRRVAALRGAAVALVLDGFLFGAFDLLPIASLARGGGVPTVLGFPTYGDGPFETLGIPTTVPLLVGFLVVCGLQVVAGVMVWFRRRDGAVLALVLLPVGGVFWWGFALPAGPVLAGVAAVLVVLGWPALRH